jgi:hypothetical protein
MQVFTTRAGADRWRSRGRDLPTGLVMVALAPALLAEPPAAQTRGVVGTKMMKDQSNC